MRDRERRHCWLLRWRKCQEPGKVSGLQQLEKAREDSALVPQKDPALLHLVPGHETRQHKNPKLAGLSRCDPLVPHDLLQRRQGEEASPEHWEEETLRSPQLGGARRPSSVGSGRGPAPGVMDKPQQQHCPRRSEDKPAASKRQDPTRLRRTLTPLPLGVQPRSVRVTLSSPAAD